MRITYDPDADVLVIVLREEARAEGRVGLEHGVTVDLDADGHIVGITVLAASKRLGGDPLAHVSIERLPAPAAPGTKLLGHRHLGVRPGAPVDGGRGQTSDGPPAASAAWREWDERSFLQELLRRTGSEEAAVAEGILGWARDWGLLAAWEQEGTDGALVPRIEHNDEWYAPFSVRTDGSIRLHLGELRAALAFLEASSHEELLSRLGEIPGIELRGGAGDDDPTISLGQLLEPGELERFLGTIDWAIEQVRAVSSG